MILVISVEGCMPNMITMCVFGNPVDKSEAAEEGTTSKTPEAKPERTFTQNATLLSFCFVGLQVSGCILTMGEVLCFFTTTPTKRKKTDIAYMVSCNRHHHVLIRTAGDVRSRFKSINLSYTSFDSQLVKCIKNS